LKEISVESTRIRQAELTDREALCDLYFEFHEFHVRGVPDRLASLGEAADGHKGSDLYRNLAAIINNDDSAIFVSEKTCEVVGMAEVYLREDESDPLIVGHKHGHLQSLMVREGFRRQRVGARLVAAAERWAKARGAVEMRLRTWEFAEGPLAFYERAGYQTLRRTMVRRL
jgi:GNAT superfamily N-acetyltransferase